MMNYNVNNCAFQWTKGTPVKGMFDPYGIATPQNEKQWVKHSALFDLR